MVGIPATTYLHPEVPAGLAIRDLPVVDARDPSLAGLVDVVELVGGGPVGYEVPITPWPVSGSRPLDPGTGVEGGTTEGAFTCTWEGDRLLATNEAVGGHYVIGFAERPEVAADSRSSSREQILLWHVNHHPDGGQLFWSTDGRPFLVPVIPVGEDPDLERAVVVRSDGKVGVCVLAGVWHDGVYPEEGDGRFRSRQGKVHARISCDVARELGVLLRIRLPLPRALS